MARGLLIGCLTGLLLSLVQVHWCGGREGDLRLRALRSVFDGRVSNIGDPLPSVIAARELANDPRVRLYDPNRTAGPAFIYPPLAAALYRPFIAQSPAKLQRSLVLANRVLLLGIGALLVGLAAPRGRVRIHEVGLAVVAILTFYPLLRSVELNQASVLVTLLLGGSWVGLRHDRQVIAGALLALAIAIKPHLVLILPLMTVHALQLVIASLITGTVLLGLSIAYAGIQNHVDYLTQMLPTVASGYSFYPNQSWNGILNRLVVDMPIDVFAVAPPNPTVRGWTLFLGVATFVAAAVLIWRWRGDRGVVVPVFGLAWLVTTMISPVAWEHHYAPGLFMFAALWASWRAGWQPSKGQALGLGISWVLLAAYFEVRHLQGGLPGLLVSYMFLGALILAVTQARIISAHSPRPGSDSSSPARP